MDHLTPPGGNGALPRLMTVTQIARHLGVAKKTVRRWQRRKMIPHLWIGRQLFFEPVAVDQWLAMNRVEPSNQPAPTLHADR